MTTSRRRFVAAIALLGIVATLAAVTEPSTAAPGDVTTFSTLADIKNPNGITLGPDGNVWLTNDGPTGHGHLTRVAPDGTMTRYDGPLAHPDEIVAGEDGELWITAFVSGDASIGRVDPADGTITTFALGLDSFAEHLVPTADGVWFTVGDPLVGRIDPDGTITTFSIPGGAGEAGGLVEGPDGNLWSTLPDRGLVVRTTPAGVVTTFASGGHPQGITTGPDGNLWVTDDGAILRVTPAGAATRFSNDLVAGATEIVTGGDDNLWFASTGSGRIGRITPAGQLRFFPHASAASASSLTVAPSGDVWYVSPLRDLVARVRPDGAIRTFGGSGVSNPGLLTVGPGGDLWFGAGTSAVGSITPAGEITTHDGPADLSAPQELVTAPDGNVWFTAPRAEADDPIGQVTPGGDVRTFGDGETCRTATPCSFVWGGVDLTVGPDQNLWFLDTEGQIVRATLEGDLSVWAAPGYPLSSIAIGSDGRLWIGGGVGGRTGGRIFRLDPATGRLRTFGTGLGSVTHDLVTGPDGRVWFLAGADRIGRIGTDGTVRTFTNPAVRDVEDLVVGPDGALWFSSHRRINRITTTGAISGWSHPAVGRALALTTGEDGNVWFVTPAASRVGRITPSGHLSLFRSPDLVVAEENVEALAVDDGLWVTSSGNDRVAHVALDGVIETTPLGGRPHGLTVGDDGHLWIGTDGGVARLELG